MILYVYVYLSSNINEVFGVILNLFSFFLQEDFTHTKSTKSTKSVKSVKSVKIIKSTPLRFFIHIENADFFAFIRLYVFCAFGMCGIFLLKKIKRFKISLITSFTHLYYYWRIPPFPPNLPMKSYLYALIFTNDHL